MSTAIVPFEDSLWPAVSRFLHEHWQANHPLCRRDLFYWQYRGFGPMAGVSSCRVVIDGGRILGFLGAIPGLYQVQGNEVAGSALALWAVADDLRNSGIGMLLLREVERQAPVTVCLGVNAKVVRYYTATGYHCLPSLHRYVCPLATRSYERLLSELPPPGHIAEWVASLDTPIAGQVEPSAIDGGRLAAEWARVRGEWQLALSRPSEFWNWRYRDAVGFTYRQFSAVGEGTVVARLDEIHSADRPALHGCKVLRLIEIMPDGESAAGRSGIGTPALLARTLAWAKRQGAIAADFQCSSTRLDPVLSAAGFRRKSPQDPATQLPELFHPLRPDVAPINLVVRIEGRPRVDFDLAYFVKSDGDMDRPTC